MSQCHLTNWMLRACLSAKRGVVGMIFCLGQRLAEEQFFKKWLGIYKHLGSLSPSREQIGVKS
jgi:hypothetical protein